MKKSLLKKDKLIHAQQQGLSLNILKPVNLVEEESKFFSNDKYNPRFEYTKGSIDFEKRIQILKSLKFSDDPFDRLLKKKCIETINRLEMFSNRTPRIFTSNSIRVYGSPSDKLLRLARMHIREYSSKLSEEPHTVSVGNAAKMFRSEISKLGFKWDVSIEHIVSDANVSPNSKKMILRKGSRLSKRQINRFIAHEIYTHILRAECGRIQPYKLFHSGTAGYLSTEEGLALYKEKIMGTLDKRALKEYSSRVVAVYCAMNKSFRETYNILNKILPKEKAWKLTVRAKRGIEDTSKPGAFTKDISYLKGYYEVNDFIKNPSCLHLLHYGKIGVKDSLAIPKIENLKDPNKLIREKKWDLKHQKLLW